MSDQLQTIDLCYTVLKYSKDEHAHKLEVARQVSTLRQRFMTFTIHDRFLDRSLKTLHVIEENLPIFKAACIHVDIITTILQFLNHIYMKLMFSNVYSPTNITHIILMSYLLFERDEEILLFVKAALLDNSEVIPVMIDYSTFIKDVAIEIIVFRDADIHALINYLKIVPFFSYLIKNIFVDEVIKDRFEWYIDKYYKTTYAKLPIRTFSTSEDLLNKLIKHTQYYTLISVWSEDIAKAKLLATKSKRFMIFINSYMEFCANIRFTKFLDVISNPYLWFKTYEELTNTDKVKEEEEFIGLIYDLFYNGTWQKPLCGEYWIQNDNTYANATREDFMICVNYAEEAYKSWSNTTLVYRRKIVTNFARELELNGKFQIADSILKWIDMPFIENILTTQDKRLELINFRRSSGVTALSDNNEMLLFTCLAISLIVGNSVIIISNKDSCNVASYVTMLLAAEIPPGVVNLLSNRNLSSKYFSSEQIIRNLFRRCTLDSFIIQPIK